jgi:hypothetical protein
VASLSGHSDFSLLYPLHTAAGEKLPGGAGRTDRRKLAEIHRRGPKYGAGREIGEMGAVLAQRAAATWASAERVTDKH